MPYLVAKHVRQFIQKSAGYVLLRLLLLSEQHSTKVLACVQPMALSLKTTRNGSNFLELLRGARSYKMRLNCHFCNAALGGPKFAICIAHLCDVDVQFASIRGKEKK